MNLSLQIVTHADEVHKEEVQEVTQQAIQEAVQVQDEADWSVHFQATTVSEQHPGFYSSKSGPNSLSSAPDFETTFSSTLFLGHRLWTNAEFYLNPEVYAGDGFGDGVGVAGFPNGEVYRVATTHFEFNLARFYLKQMFGFGSDVKYFETDQNKIARTVPVERLTFIVGKFSISDFIDTNDYANDARTQFLNWSLMNNGAWDYAADAHGYVFGLFIEYRRPEWTARVAMSREARRSDDEILSGESDINHAHTVNGEWMLPYRFGEQSGKLKFLGYVNSAYLGSYREALSDFAKDSEEDLGGEISLASTRQYREKFGFGINLSHALSSNLGVFTRLGWSDGETEVASYTEVDHTVSAGLVLTGEPWQRVGDSLGLALVLNGLSKDHANYLASGGEGFMVGDGYLDYAPEQILETYYLFNFPTGFSITPDFQWIQNPGYNATRGPVFVFSGRLHFEF